MHFLLWPLLLRKAILELIGDRNAARHSIQPSARRGGVGAAHQLVFVVSAVSYAATSSLALLAACGLRLRIVVIITASVVSVAPPAVPTAAAGPATFLFSGMVVNRGDEIHRFLAQGPSSWNLANAHCASQGMFLTTIRDATQWTAVRNQYYGCAIGGITTVVAPGTYGNWFWVDTPSPQNHRFSGLVAHFGRSDPRGDTLSEWNAGYWVWDPSEPSQYAGTTPEDRLAVRETANDVSGTVEVDPVEPPGVRYGSAACVKFRCNSADDCNGNAVDDPAAVQYFNRNVPCRCNCKAGYSGPTCWHAAVAHGGERYVRFTGTYLAAAAAPSQCGELHPYMHAASASSLDQFDFMQRNAGNGCQLGAVGVGSRAFKWLEGRWRDQRPNFLAQLYSSSPSFTGALNTYARFNRDANNVYTLVSLDARRVSLCYHCAVHMCTVESDCATVYAAGSVIAVDGMQPNCSCTVLNQNDELTRLSFISPSVPALGVTVTGNTRADAAAAVAASPNNHGVVAEPPSGARRSEAAVSSTLHSQPPAWRGTQP